MEAPPQLAGFCIFCLVTGPCCPLPATYCGALGTGQKAHASDTPLSCHSQAMDFKGVLAQAAHSVGGCLMALKAGILQSGASMVRFW